MAEFDSGNLDGLREAYDEDGYAVVRRVLDAAFVAELARHIDWLIERNPDVRPETLGHWMIAEDPFWVRFVSDERLLDIAEPLVGPNIAMFAADYICKPPAHGRPLLWHQDANYWPLVPMEVITVWFAVSESNRQNGCVRMIPGSHRLGTLEHERTADMDNVLNSGIKGDVFDESQAVDIELEPGDISIHHPLTLHGSNPNTSDRWRRGGSIQYMPTTTRIAQDNWPCAFLFRGEPAPGVNDYLPKPKYVAGAHMPFRGCEAWA